MAGGRGVTYVHKDPPLVGVAVHTAVADGVIEAFVLENEKTDRSEKGRMETSDGFNTRVQFSDL